jgi:hypothetical protein
MLALLVKSTGEPEELSHQSKIKDNVDHVGLLLQLLPINLIKSKTDIKLIKSI